MAETRTELDKMTEQRDKFGQAALNNRIDLEAARALLQEVIDSPLGDHMRETRRKIKEFLNG